MQTSELASIYRKAARLVAKGWSQGAYARCNGVKVDLDDPKANRFCLYGAVRRAASNDPYSTKSEAAVRILSLDYEVGPMSTNDDPTTTQDDIVTFLLLIAEDCRG